MVGKKVSFITLWIAILLISLLQINVKTLNAQELSSNLPYASFVNEQSLSLNAKGAILISSDSGHIIYALNEHQKLAPASITKLMTLYVVLEKINEGTLSWQHPVTTSLNAARIEEAQVYLRQGETYSLQEMIKAMLIPSANDAAVAIAEMVAGSETAFVKIMNLKAEELGLTDSHFINVTGLPTHTANDNYHYMSAHDIAKLARVLITKYPEVLEFTKQQNTTFRNGTYKISNTNKLLGYYSWMDGLKTGYTNRAGLCLASTAKRNDTRLISVVLGAPNESSRQDSTIKLLDYGFNNNLVQRLKIDEFKKQIPNHPLFIKGTMLVPWLVNIK
jgi:D-alanyl-D-alanine carboxypeptidase (penicillin-binding protein 5/6)